MHRDMPGPGDPATWPPYTGNPNDPRSEGWLDDLDTVSADDTRCPICGGCGWVGTHVEINGQLYVHSPGESDRSAIVLRDALVQPKRLTVRMLDSDRLRDMERHGMKLCPVCEAGEHPDAVCGAGRCVEREVVVDSDGTLTGLCAGHWIDLQLEDAGWSRLGDGD